MTAKAEIHICNVFGSIMFLELLNECLSADQEDPVTNTIR
jgi:hypothetical protein